MKKDINFYRECLREEMKRQLKKPFFKRDYSYLIDLDKTINNLKKEKK